MKVIEERESAAQEEHANGGAIEIDPTSISVSLNYGVDKIFAVIVTFAPMLAVAAAVWMHVAGIHRVGLFDLGVMAGMHLLALTGLELGFHRLFAHRSYQASRGVKILFAALGSMAFQGPVIWWPSIHRKHHRYSDLPGDPHSMYLFGDGFWARLRGFIHSHIGWIWTKSSIRFPDQARYVLDLYRDRDLFRIHMRYFYFMTAGFVIPGIAGALYYRGLAGFGLGVLWGGFLRIFAMNHLTFWGINTFTHGIFGSARYRTKDKSTNSWVLGALTLGQGWHNNHHAFPYSAIMGHRWWQIDVGTWVLLVLEKLGLVRDLKFPSQELMERRRYGSDVREPSGISGGLDAPGDRGPA